MTRIALATMLLFALLLTVGCVRRRLTVRTNPPGADVYVDNYPIGRSPVSVPFTYYGTRKIRIEKDGYETIEQLHQIGAPWYEYTPLDFVSENLWPWEIEDERVVDFQLPPRRQVPTNELLRRAEQLREGVTAGYATPVPQ